MALVTCLGCHTPSDCKEMQRCLNADVYTAQHLRQREQGRATVPITVAGTSTPATPRSGPLPAPAGPPRGGGRAVIWEHMDKVWDQAGKPSDVKLVLALRKRCMDELEPLGVKRSSASSELGNWMKARCPQ